MKRLKLALLPVIFMLAITVIACKGKTDKNTTDTVGVALPDTMRATEPEPLPASSNDSLSTMANDAVKDYPGVTATVSNGEVTLTGTITREKLPKLMAAISATHPKKINNNLTIK
jgi:hypothetical protein